MTPVLRDLPSGTVTFLFTDVEGSTRLLHELGPDRYAAALAAHRQIVREAFRANGGVEVDTQGDAFFVAFPTAPGALRAAAEALVGLASGPIRVRVGIHTGTPHLAEEGYVGVDVHRAARIAGCGHGGQVLVSAATASLAGTEGLRDLGEHRLKDLSAPERIYQLGEDEFPPLKSLHQTNLPVQPNPMVGRERELAEVLKLLGSCRLLTLTGAGGSGKTRLALQAAAEAVDEYPDGVWFVSLASLTEPELLEITVAQVIGASGDLAQFLRSKKLLLLLDNVEQLLPDVAPRISALGTDVLATSRERLNVLGEQEFPVQTLPTADAVVLFTQRARALKPAFQPDAAVAEIARRLDGLPLALELAAARVKVLNTDQILERLGGSLDLLTAGATDAPERQRTLRATIAWSHELLTEKERRLFADLAVFPGSFDLEAAESVADADLDVLASLIDKSLLRETENGRFFFLETIREYALERLEATTAKESVREKHAERALRRAVCASDASDTAVLAWLAQVEDDYADFYAALSWLHHRVDDRFLLLASRLARFWDARHYLHEGRVWLDAALANATPQATPVMCEALLRRAHIVWRRGDPDTFDAIGAAEAVAQELGDVKSLAWLRAIRGAEALRSGETPQARQEYERALDMFREVGAVREIAINTHDLGIIAWKEGDYVRAREFVEESLEVCRAASLIGLEPGFNGTLGFVALAESELAEAERHFSESIRLDKAANAGGVGVVDNLLGLAATRCAEGECEDACLMLGAYDAYMQSSGEAEDPQLGELRTGVLAAAEARLGYEGSRKAMAIGAALSVREALDHALSHPGSVVSLHEPPPPYGSQPEGRRLEPG
jgi:predicted ATPase/class 3 adenylate cyclase